MIKWALLFVLIALTATMLGYSGIAESVTSSVANIIIDASLGVVLLLAIMFGATLFEDRGE